MIANDIYEKSSHIETLRNRLLSVPLSGPMDKYYVTSAYGYRKDSKRAIVTLKEGNTIDSSLEIK